MLKILSRGAAHSQIEKFGIESQKRHVWLWLNKMFNQADPDRIKKVGANRACAEWLLRNGAALKWVGDQNLSNDYNALPSSGACPAISEIDASDSSISHYGFEHLSGCKNVEKITLHNCSYLQDEAITNLRFIDSPVKYIQISKCPNITDAGLLNFPKIDSLKEIKLFDLSSVKNISECKNHFNKLLPSCNITEN